MSNPSSSELDADAASPEYYYTVLNLPSAASSEEIRDKYKQLSLIFHPDKQVGAELKETATQTFLQIQKAYEGLKGLELVRKSELDGLLLDDFAQFQKELARRKAHRNYINQQEAAQPTATTTIGLDATSLTAVIDDDLPLHQQFRLRLSSIRTRAMRRSLGNHTALTCSSIAFAGFRESYGRRRVAVGTSFTGLLTHQLSPQWGIFAESNLLQAPNLRLGTTYSDGDNQLDIEAHLSPSTVALTTGGTLFALDNPLDLIPPFSVSYGRRLFPDSQGTASISITTASSLPALSIAFSTGESAWDEDDDERDFEFGTENRSPSLYGFSSRRAQWATGVQLQGVVPSIFASSSILFAEMGLRLYGNLVFGLLPNVTFGATWNAMQDAASGPQFLTAQVAIGVTEVSLKLRQIIQLPIVLSDSYDTAAAFWTTVVPSTSVALAYYFILRPRQRQRRIEFFRQARRDLRESKADKVRPVEETVSLLRDAAKRHMRVEASVDGLIITDAQYGPVDRDEAARGLDIDVTIPLQVLVNNSQLYIPGKRSKTQKEHDVLASPAGIPGFYDPAPSIAKSLRVHYTFRGRPHYAETPDHLPVVLPLEGELRALYSRFAARLHTTHTHTPAFDHCGRWKSQSQKKPHSSDNHTGENGLFFLFLSHQLILPPPSSQ
ncbi:hypothetical protein BDY19DRAFT_909620 [Irpex rosettiformis]|uniref:Uncharacterized protein n=1 Tax=Irpex rosettiformis TaxID=378272 RepID=A0ACB8TS07_9APHY|nr:hypothetical protein BDY19DRAFT_909620 [Irpex rosettiformis]